jgi:hypothetical protein
MKIKKVGGKNRKAPNQNEVGREYSRLLPKHLGWREIVSNHGDPIEQGGKGTNGGTKPKAGHRGLTKAEEENGRH